LVVRDNDVYGRIEGNGIRNGVFENNRLRAGGGSRPMMSFGFSKNLLIKGNTIIGDEPETIGIYVWGASQKNQKASTDVIIESNSLKISGQPIFLNGVNGGTVRGNTVHGKRMKGLVKLKRCENIIAEDSIVPLTK